MKPNYAPRKIKVDWLRAHRPLWEGLPRETVLERVALAMRQEGLYSPTTKSADIVPGLRRLLARAHKKDTGKARRTVTLYPCDHEHWAVRSWLSPGNGQCLDCRRVVPLPTLVAGLERRVRAHQEGVAKDDGLLALSR